MSQLLNVSISEEQLRWLSDHSLIPETLMSYLRKSSARTASNRQLPTAIVEAICDALTLALAEIGFDGDENLTEDGEKLEALIEQFTRFD